MTKFVKVSVEALKNWQSILASNQYSFMDHTQIAEAMKKYLKEAEGISEKEYKVVELSNNIWKETEHFNKIWENKREEEAKALEKMAYQLILDRLLNSNEFREKVFEVMKPYISP